MEENARKIYVEGCRYYLGTNGYPLNYNKALECIRKAAELGVSDAMNLLGTMYEEGNVVEKNDKTAFNWYLKAFQADSKNVKAIINLGRACLFGCGVEKDIERAYKSFDVAVDLKIDDQDDEYAQACFYKGYILMEHYRNYKDAFHYFVHASNFGNIPDAWHNIGYLIETGRIPVSETGNDSAASRDGVAKDYYEKAANLGLVQSMYAVGVLYCRYNLTDEGMPWIKKAAAKGYEPAKKYLKAPNSSLWDLICGLFK